MDWLPLNSHAPTDIDWAHTNRASLHLSVGPVRTRYRPCLHESQPRLRWAEGPISCDSPTCADPQTSVYVTCRAAQNGCQPGPVSGRTAPLDTLGQSPGAQYGRVQRKRIPSRPRRWRHYHRGRQQGASTWLREKERPYRGARGSVSRTSQLDAFHDMGSTVPRASPPGSQVLCQLPVGMGRGRYPAFESTCGTTCRTSSGVITSQPRPARVCPPIC